MAVITVICEYCGKEFRKPESVIKRTKHNFCSAACCGTWNSINRLGENNSQSKKRRVNCSECNADILRKISDINSHGVLFCCVQCRYNWQKRITGENNPHYQRQSVECSGCGIVLNVISFRIKTYGHCFCNKACYGVWVSRTRIEEGHPRWNSQFIACEICNKKVKRQPYQLSRNHVLCSRKCYGIWISRNRSGENNPFWKGGDIDYYGPSWRAARRATRARDKYRCRHCHISEKKLGQELDVHHIQPFRTFGYVLGDNENHLDANQLTNLICLCRTCHLAAENGRIPLQLSLC